jgi:signal transduction histidine kinase
MPWLFFLLGLVAGAAVAALLTYLAARKALRRARRVTARARAKERMAELAGLTGGLAHEIRNPLSTIKLNLQLLEEDFAGSTEERYRRNFARLKRLEEEVQRLHDILDDFLKFAGQTELQRESVDLRRLVDELVDFFRPQAERQRVVLRPSLPEAPLQASVDPGLIKQAVLNLMINATQAMTEGGELLLRLSPRDGSAMLEVIDTGPGVPEELQEQIFDAYFSTRPGGSGLGLPMTRRIVHQHGGEITLESQPGKGTRFLVKLPLAEPEE